MCVMCTTVSQHIAEPVVLIDTESRLKGSIFFSLVSLVLDKETLRPGHGLPSFSALTLLVG